MKNVVISILGVRLDQKGLSNRRWQQWRPNLSIVMDANFVVDEFVLLHQPDDIALLNLTLKDMREASPNTIYHSHVIGFDDAWDFEQVYSQLHDFTKSYRFNPELNNYYVHISTGTHVAQICLFLLTEARYIPGKLLQTSPGKEGARGSLHIIDLDLSRYDQIAARFEQTSQEGISYLKQGIDTKNQAFNALIAMLEKISIRSPAPILLTGKTGVGKSRLAKLLYELKKQRGMVQGKFVEVNCATLRGDNAMSALFGHTKGAFTGRCHLEQDYLKKHIKACFF